MEFFLSLVLVYPSDLDQRRNFYYQYDSFQACNEARKPWITPDKETAKPPALSAVCSSGRAPAPSAFQQQQDQATGAIADRIVRELKKIDDLTNK